MPAIADAIRTDQEIAERIKRDQRNKKLRMGIPPEQEETTESAFAGIKDAKPAGMGKAIVSHRTDPMITMYALPYGSPRAIPEGSVRVCLNEGLHLDCPICGQDHPDQEVCPTLPKVQFRRCPVCGKRFPDDRAAPEAQSATEEGLIPTELPGSPEDRTKAKMEAHMVVYHEEAARRMGLLKADSIRK